MTANQSFRESISVILQSFEANAQELRNIRKDLQRIKSGVKNGAQAVNLCAQVLGVDGPATDGLHPLNDPLEGGQLPPVLGEDSVEFFQGGLHIVVHAPTVASVTVTITQGVTA